MVIVSTMIASGVSPIMSSSEMVIASPALITRAFSTMNFASISGVYCHLSTAESASSSRAESSNFSLAILM